MCHNRNTLWNPRLNITVMTHTWLLDSHKNKSQICFHLDIMVDKLMPAVYCNVNIRKLAEIQPMIESMNAEYILF